MARADTLCLLDNGGRNLTPQYLLDSVHKVLPKISLDPCSDPVANSVVQATKIYTAEEDGFSRDWFADTLFMNPPGKTQSGGKQISASDWFQKLWDTYRRGGRVNHAIYLVYRAGSIGGVPYEMLQNSAVCLTCKQSPQAGKTLSGSGRIGFETVKEDGSRHPQDLNTQSSLIGILTRHDDKKRRFMEEFSSYGAVFVPNLASLVMGC